MPDVPKPRTRAPRKQAQDQANGSTTGTTETPGSSVPRPDPQRSRSDAKLAESLKGMYEGVALLCYAVGLQRSDDRLMAVAGQLTEPKRAVEPSTGAVVVIDERTGADRIVDAWMTLADRNPRVKAALVRFTEGGAAAEVVALHVGLVMPFLPGIPGIGAVMSNGNGNGVHPDA